MYPNVTVIRRNGEINAWDNAEFRAVVGATGKKQMIVAGITNDVSHLARSFRRQSSMRKQPQVCTMFVALSLLEAGYTVFANADASGTFDTRTADLANARMRDAGAYVMPQLSIVADLQRDWNDPPGVAGLLNLFFKYVIPWQKLPCSDYHLKHN